MQKEVIEKLAQLITAAFGLVAALAWNEAIKAFFVTFFGTSGSLPGMLAYALLVTVLAVVVTIQIGKASGVQV